MSQRAREPMALHSAISGTLRDQILSGELIPGEPLASESELSARFEVSRGTIRHALAALRGEGLISGGRGRRPVVSRPPLTQSFDELVSFSAWAESLGRVPSAHTLELVRRPADPEAALHLGIAPGDSVFQYRRLRLLDGVPAMIEISIFIEDVGRLLLDCDMDHGSVYAQLGERGVVFSEAQQRITAIAAGAEQASLLAVTRRAPLLEVTRLTLGPDGRALEYARDTYRGEEFAITVYNRAVLPRAGVGLALVS